MADFIATLASKAGIDTGSARNGLGALLSTFRQFLPPDAYDHVVRSLPGAAAILEKFQTTKDAVPRPTRSGLAETPRDLVSSPSAAAAAMMTQLSRGGLSFETIRRFLPAASGMLQDLVPPGVFEEIERTIPGLAQDRPKGRDE